jgi:hypothetical protein
MPSEALYNMSSVKLPALGEILVRKAILAALVCLAMVSTAMPAATGAAQILVSTET